MNLKDQRMLLFKFLVGFGFFIFISVLHGNQETRIDMLERNQIKKPIKLLAKVDNLYARIEVKNQVQAGIEVAVTAYNAVKSQTDNTPNRTASNNKPREGFCGVLRDLEKLLGLKFGDILYLKGLNRYEGKYVFPMCQFQDRMHKRKKKQVDIYMESVKEAKKFGIRKAKLFIIRKDK